ncbi:MAG: VOC family protein [Pseudomonadota bacterium]
MEKVLGLGGVFFRSQDPAELGQWYLTHLGINLVPTGPDSAPWIAEGGVTVFAPFEADTDYFEADRTFMLNFRVADLDAMLAQLRAADIAVSHETAMEGLGRFARIHDPEGNPVELWEPAAPPG